MVSIQVLVSFFCIWPIIHMAQHGGCGTTFDKSGRIEISSGSGPRVGELKAEQSGIFSSATSTVEKSIITGSDMFQTSLQYGTQHMQLHDTSVTTHLQVLLT